MKLLGQPWQLAGSGQERRGLSQRAASSNLSTSTISLTIGDTAGYAAQGVMINLFLENDRVRFEINDEAAQKASIDSSSKLLSRAKLVDN